MYTLCKFHTLLWNRWPTESRQEIRTADDDDDDDDDDDVH